MSSTPGELGQEAEPVPIASLDLYQLLELFVVLLSDQAWRCMGLRVDSKTSKITTDFERAHVAIECVIAIVDKLEPHLTGPAKSRFRSLITDLQINYARQLGKR